MDIRGKDGGLDAGVITLRQVQVLSALGNEHGSMIYSTGRTRILPNEG